MKLEMRGNAIYKDDEKQYDFDSFAVDGEMMAFFKDEMEVGSVNRSLLAMAPPYPQTVNVVDPEPEVPTVEVPTTPQAAPKSKKSKKA